MAQPMFVSALRKPKHVLGFLAIVLALWIVCLWPSARIADSTTRAHRIDERPSSPALTDAHVQSASATRVSQRADRAFADLLASSRNVARADLIEQVALDKRYVCPGEDVLVSVRGKEKNAGSILPIAELDFNVAGKFGNSIVVRSDEPGMQDFTVVAANGVDKVDYRPFQVQVLSADEPACAQRSYATLSVERATRDQDSIRAVVLSTHGLSGSLRYDWDFGDGARATTDEPNAEHSYALREQTRRIASFVVEVRVSDAHGHQAIGRDSIHLQNTNHDARAFGNRLTKVVYDPFPKEVAGGYGFDVTFRNLEHEPITYDHVTMKQKSCLADHEDRISDLSVRDIAAPRRLGATQTYQASLVIPARLVASDTCVVELELSGDSIPRRIGAPMENSPIPFRAVTAQLTFELRAAPIAQAGGAQDLASHSIADAELAQQVQAASRLLGSSRVTPEQVRLLAQAGRL